MLLPSRLRRATFLPEEGIKSAARERKAADAQKMRIQKGFLREEAAPKGLKEPAGAQEWA